MGIGACTSALVSYLNNGTAVPMATVMAGCALVSFTILMIGSKIIRNQVTAEEAQEETAEMVITS